MSSRVQPTTIQKILEMDRTWCAYAIADLDPMYFDDCRWFIDREAAVLIYRGLEPPVLFAQGSPQEVSRLFSQVAGGEYQFTLLGIHRAELSARLRPSKEVQMWRMVLKQTDLLDAYKNEVVQLDQHHAPAIHELFSGQPDLPDSFHPSQLDSGHFFGIFKGDQLQTVAGIHVISQKYGVGALGNVFTHPSHRGKGLATRASAAVVRSLLQKGIETIVLNVSMENADAIRSYQKIGFWPYCGYQEGVGWLLTSEDVKG